MYGIDSEKLDNYITGGNDPDIGLGVCVECFKAEWCTAWPEDCGGPYCCDADCEQEEEDE